MLQLCWIHLLVLIVFGGIFLVVQLLSCVWLLRPHGLQHARLPCPSPSGVCSDACPLSQWCHPAILSSVVPFSSCLMIFPNIRIFSNESALCIGWPKYWRSSFSISLSNEHLGMISFRIDWLDLLAIQGTLKESSPEPQFKSMNSSVLSLFYGPTLISIHDYGKNHSLTIQTFDSKVMSLLFNTLSSFAIDFFPRSKCLLISRLQSLSTVILETKKRKSVPVSTFPLSICHEVIGLRINYIGYRTQKPTEHWERTQGPEIAESSYYP